MRRRAILATPLFVVASAALAQSWTEYRTDDGRFRVQMPGTPAVRKSALAIGNNETAPAVEAVARASSATYQVATIAYPQRVAQSASADVMLDHFRKNLVGAETYKNNKTVMLGRVPGREFLMVEGNGRNTAVRQFWSRGTLYSLTVTGNAGIDAQPDVRKFLESFAPVAA